MKNQILTELQAKLERFAEAKDPRNISVSKQEIIKCFNTCPLENKELLAEMSSVFFETREQKKSADWESIQFLLFRRIIQCVDFYICTKEEALDHLSEGDHPRQVLAHLMRRYKISAQELRTVREEALIQR